MIITHIKDNPNINSTFMNNFPNPFTLEKEKLNNKENIRATMDYFANYAYASYVQNEKRIGKNYRLLKGIITNDDFYRESYIPQFGEVIDDFTNVLGGNELPQHVRHYPIMNPPLNTLKGELQKRPNIHRVKAMDSDSRAEELEYKTTQTQNLILEGASRLIINQLALKGIDAEDIDPEELNKAIADKIEDLLTDYTSLAERWGNHILSALQVYFNLSEKSSEAFTDLLISSREFYEVYEDNSKIGFNVRVHNPKNVWMIGTPDTKYTSGVSGERGTPYAIGTIYVQEISEIIEEFPELTKEEIDHLIECQKEYMLLDSPTTVGTKESGIDSIHYSTYDRGVYQERQFLESQLNDPYYEAINSFQQHSSTYANGYKFAVVKAYHCSKKEIAVVTFKDEEGNIQSTLVDETYEKSPNEISIERGYVNQWYQHVRIGKDIYLVKPATILDYCPIIGMIYEAKNTPPASLVDLMKPYQMLFNVVMNQLWELTEKEIGNVAAINLRRVPRNKEGDDNDAIDAWEQNARERGIIFDDDSPENLKAPVSNQSVARNVDLTRSNEMQTRLNMAVQLQEMCWQLVGMNRQRLGASLATQTATANQNDLQQSFSQTEPYYTAHNCVLSQLYQAIIDASQYIESKKPYSSINFLTPQGESQFMEIPGSDLNLKDFFVMVTSRAEDLQLFNEFRQLSQAMLQNGTHIYDVSMLYTTNSIRTMQKVFKDLKAKNESMMQQQQQNEAQIAQAQQQTEMAKLEQEERHFQIEVQKDIYLGELKSQTDLTKAELNTYFQKPETDTDGDGTPDIMEIANHQIKQQEILRKTNLENKKLSLQLQEFIQKKDQQKIDNEIAKEKLTNEKEKIKIAKRKPAPKKK